MSEWLDIMLEEIARKQREEREARQEIERREIGGKNARPAQPSRDDQSK
ncbi:MAG: hypothetical protein KJO46_07765 [Gammaproteobacteria bacterium]|nr:hypothetical protein [Gammaproteobacteria bacterium]